MRLVPWLPVVLVLALAGCSDSSTPQDDGGQDAQDDGSNGGDTGKDGGSGDGDTGVCDEQQITLELAGVQVMLLVDASGSMRDGTKWADAKDAIVAMVGDPGNTNTLFGLDVFPDPGLLNCSTDGPVAVEIGPDRGAAIALWMDNNQPSLIALTPLVDALQYYMLTPTSPLHNPDTANYIVVVSDGEDTCFRGHGNFQEHDKLNILAGIVHDLKDVAGIKTIAVGFGDSAPEGELGIIAQNGGSTFDTFIQATDRAELEAALVEIAQAIRPCRYLLTSPDARADPAKVNFYFDQTAVPRDRTNTNGWNWTKSERLEVQFYGDACEQIKTGAVTSVSATFGCPTRIGPTQDICSTRDFYLRFPAVGVLLLQDFSGSMTDADKWADATTAITRMIVDDKNNYVEFGLDLFPDTHLIDDYCGIDNYPNVPVGRYNNYAIIDQISNNDPFGSTPLLNALKRITFRPGRIGESRVSGSLVVISDGADTCAENVDVVAELGANTQSLVDNYSIKVFAIGFGSEVNPAELNAIAAAGGTGLNTYAQANNLAELQDIFSMISSMVTSCVFEVPYAGIDVDYSQVNFYFDGIPVPRDSQHVNGWDWVNPVTMTEVEFFGTWCDMLKNGEVIDVLVEFGCETYYET
jgi:Mg-chelatase subunit ChlD